MYGHVLYISCTYIVFLCPSTMQSPNLTQRGTLSVTVWGRCRTRHQGLQSTCLHTHLFLGETCGPNPIHR